MNLRLIRSIQAIFIRLSILMASLVFAVAVFSLALFGDLNSSLAVLQGKRLTLHLTEVKPLRSNYYQAHVEVRNIGAAPIEIQGFQATCDIQVDGLNPETIGPFDTKHYECVFKRNPDGRVNHLSIFIDGLPVTTPL